SSHYTLYITSIPCARHAAVGVEGFSRVARGGSKLLQQEHKACLRRLDVTKASRRRACTRQRAPGAKRQTVRELAEGPTHLPHRPRAVGGRGASPARMDRTAPQFWAPRLYPR